MLPKVVLEIQYVVVELIVEVVEQGVAVVFHRAP